MENQEKTKEEQMLQEIATLKRQIGWFRLTNERLRKKVESLTHELEKAKAYGDEADELNERKADMVYSMKKEKATQDAIIKELKETIATLQEELSSAQRPRRDKTEDECQDINEGFNSVEPWYKRIFKWNIFLCSIIIDLLEKIGGHYSSRAMTTFFHH